MASYCGFPACDGGHIGKHATCLSRALYEVCSDMADESCGHTDWGFMALFLIPAMVTVKASEWSGPADLVIDGGQWLTLFESTSGQVWIADHPTEQDARKAYDEFAYEYDLWSAADMGVEI